ncbi:MAG: hypothetical protein JNL11_09165 [Bdellovibrionaceae bacterium]|nr:hypothetical protein [Pseudobdellovibrionaceae bacterium]
MGLAVAVFSLTPPLASNFCPGVVVPMPTLPPVIDITLAALTLTFV